MADTIIRVSAANGMARGFFADTARTADAAAGIHGTSATAGAALGRLLTAAALMGQTLKDDGDRLSLILKCGGPLGGCIVTADAGGRVKGYPYNPTADAPSRGGKLDVAAIVGCGTLRVIRDMGLKEPYAGEVALQTGEIAEDVAYYFAQSEQTPAAVALGVLVETDLSVKRAGGFIVQATPGADETLLAAIEANVSALPPVTAMLADGLTPEGMAARVFGGIPFEVTGKTPASYACDCGEERVRAAVMTMGEDEIARVLAEDGHITAHCHFCGKDYTFGAELLKS